MKAILITNPESNYTDPIRTWIESSAACSPHSRKARKGDTGLLTVISSQEGFNKAKILSEFKDDADTNFVFIVPELNWPGLEDEGFNAGYKIALMLMTDILGDRFFNLVFISSLKRHQLTRTVSKQYLEFINSCPHRWLDDLCVTAMAPVYSRIHFELIRRVMASSTGRIDYIKHSLNSLGAKKLEEAKRETSHVLDMLSMDVYSETAPEMTGIMAGLRGKLSSVQSTEGILEIKDELDNLTTMLQNRLVSEPDSRKENYSVLIIEDHPEDRERLVGFFQSRFRKVAAFDDEQLKKAIVRREKGHYFSSGYTKDESVINEVVGKYNIIILDLMYKDNNGDADRWLDFNGFDLYQAIRNGEGRRKAVRKAAIRIVTSLPRNEVSLLSEKYLYKVKPPKVFTKGKDWYQLQACLIDRMDEILDECRKNDEEYAQKIGGSGSVNLSHSGIMEMLHENWERYSYAVSLAQAQMEKDIPGNDADGAMRSVIIDMLQDNLDKHKATVSSARKMLAGKKRADGADKDKPAVPVAKNVPRKRNGLFKKPAIVEALLENWDLYLEAVSAAGRVLSGEKIKSSELKDVLFHTTQTQASTCDPDEFINDKLNTLILYRHLLILFSVRHGGPVTEAGFHSFLKNHIIVDPAFENKLPHLNKSFINGNLGLSVDKWDTVDGEQSCALCLDESWLFDEEKKLLEYDEPFDGDVAEWAHNLLASFVDPCEDDDSCQLRLPDIYNTGICSLIYRERQQPDAISVKEFKEFLKQSIDFIMDKKGFAGDRQYIQDTFIEDDVNLEEAANRTVARTLRNQYSIIFQLVSQITAYEINI